MKNFLIFLLAGILSSLTFAETCPSLDKIKHHQIQGWQLYDSSEGTLLEKKRTSQFMQQAEKFVLAEWVAKNAKTGTIHCYYRNSDGNNFEAYLAKDKLSPHKNRNEWYQVTDLLQCAAGLEKCTFDANPSYEIKNATKISLSDDVKK